MSWKVPVLPQDFKPSSLSSASHVIPLADEENAYSATLASDWCIGVVPHGGYLTTILQRTTIHAFTHRPLFSTQNQPDPIYTHVTFLSRCSRGPCKLLITPLKLGRQYSVVQVSLWQEKTLCLQATITHSNLSLETGQSLPTTIPARSKIPDRITECELWTPEDPRIRPAPAKLVYYKPKNRSRDDDVDGNVLEQWVSLNDCAHQQPSSSRLTLESLGFICDCFLSLPEHDPACKGKFWYPTLSLDLEVKKPPPPSSSSSGDAGRAGWEWLFVRVHAFVVRNGRMDVNVLILDEQGECVALSRHVALVVGAERNTDRGGAGKL